MVQPYATHPLFLDNLHFEHFVNASISIKVELFDEFVAAMRGDCLKKGDEWHTAGMVAFV
jgi:hypothetical protein